MIIDEESGVDRDPMYVYCKSFRHWRTGRRIVAPPGKVFRFRSRPRRRR